MPATAVQVYVDALKSSPQALRSSFEFYRAIDEIIAQNTERKKTKLKMPVLTIAGEIAVGTGMETEMRAVAENVRSVLHPEGRSLPDGRESHAGDRRPQALPRSLPRLTGRVSGGPGRPPAGWRTPSRGAGQDGPNFGRYSGQRNTMDSMEIIPISEAKDRLTERPTGPLASTITSRSPGTGGLMPSSFPWPSGSPCRRALEILADPEMRADLVEAAAAEASGDVTTEEEMAAIMAARLGKASALSDRYTILLDPPARRGRSPRACPRSWRPQPGS